jgi:pyridoxamine 5'-phosphate oxidase family protein
MPFTNVELEYLRSQRLGRLATVDPAGAPQNSPVGFRLDPEAGTIEIGGLSLGTTRKFRNVEATGQVSFVVDDLASVNPWKVRGIEIRGEAEALRDQIPASAHLSPEIIRIHPKRVISWGIPGAETGMNARDF